MTNVPIVSGATAWDDNTTGLTYILVINEALYYGPRLDHSLLNPNQLRIFGVDLWDNPFDPAHPLGIELLGGFTIPMVFKGTKLRFKSRVPTRQELDSCEHIELTSSQPWNPENVTLSKVTANHDQQVLGMTSTLSTIDRFTNARSYCYQDNFCGDYLLHSVEPSLVELKERIISAVNVTHDHDDIPARKTFVSYERHRKLSAESISELWCIGLQKAKETLNATTQRGIRSAILPLSRRYRADRRYNMKRLNGKFATDTLYAQTKSLNQNVYAQMYTHKSGFAVCYPIPKATGEDLGYTLQDFCNDFGVPEHLKSDGAMNQVGSSTLFKNLIRKYDIKHTISEPRRPNQNPAEAAIREIKKRWYRVMMKKKIPIRLWDYGMVWICETGNLSVSSSRYANGRTSLELMTGETPDISEYTDFGIYDWVIFKSNAGLGENELGRWLGVSHKIGDQLSYWILPKSCRPISCVTVQRLTRIEQRTDEWKLRMQEFTNSVDSKLEAADTDRSAQVKEQPAWNRLSLDDEDVDFLEDFNRVINDASILDVDDIKDNKGEGVLNEDYTPDAFDGYLNMEVGLPRGPDDQLVSATVKKRAIDCDGLPIGKRNDNPLLDSRTYEVEFIDGSSEVISANVIAENLLSQVDEDGHRQLFIQEIIDHRVSNEAIPKSEGFITTKYGSKRKVRTTKGWELCVEWKDGSTDWVSLKDMKNAYPVQVAEYAIRNDINDEPAFAWWVSHTMKKRTAIISKLKSKYWQRTHKYGIRIPKSVQEAYQIDKEQGNNFWREAIEAEMKKIIGAFDRYEGNIEDLVGYQEVTTHMIFDVKLGENFRRKARLVGDGHKTETPSSVTYSSVVSRDSVRLCLMIAALNDLKVLAADIENAYLTAPCREKVWTRGGAEFGSYEGQVFIIVKALYGLKSSGAAFRAHLAEVLDEIGFRSSMADPDVWTRPSVKPDGESYYEYILVYVDDILCMSHDPKDPMEEISGKLRFKKDRMDPPEMYLGAKLEYKSINGRMCWAMSCADYIKAAVEIVEAGAKKRGLKLPSKCDTPMTSNYHPELDGSPELEADDITFYQELIGMLRWSIEIGRVDIYTEVSLLSAYQAAPRQGHLEQMLRIYSYVKKKPKITLYFDPQLPVLPEDAFEGDSSHTFKDQYRDAIEEIPPNVPIPRGRSVIMTAFVDASHAANKVTRRSHTGYIIFVNRAPIIWYSKRQNTVESSTFSSEFIAMKTCVEHIAALRYKIRMFGIPIDGPTNILCDNKSVVNNSSKLSSTLNKKHNSIAYHLVRWAVAAESIRVGWIATNANIADAMTKRLAANVRDGLFGSWTY